MLHLEHVPNCSPASAKENDLKPAQHHLLRRLGGACDKNARKNKQGGTNEEKPQSKFVVGYRHIRVTLLESELAFAVWTAGQ